MFGREMKRNMMESGNRGKAFDILIEPEYQDEGRGDEVGDGGGEEFEVCF